MESEAESSSSTKNEASVCERRREMKTAPKKRIELDGSGFIDSKWKVAKKSTPKSHEEIDEEQKKENKKKNRC